VKYCGHGFQKCKGLDGLFHKKLRVLVILVALSLVSAGLAVYYLSTLHGPSLQIVSPVQGQIQYSGTNDALEPWNLTIIWTSNPWYARLNVTDAGYIGEVRIEWWLERGEADWVDIAPTEHVITAIELTDSTGQIIYATNNGSILNNKNWGSLTTTPGEYRISSRIEIP